jgi:hypothetical protein
MTQQKQWRRWSFLNENLLLKIRELSKNVLEQY